MTFDECHQTLVAIRRQQGTRCPLVRVACDGSVHEGRLIRSDSDPEHRQGSGSPFGVLVLEPLGLTRVPQTILQIDSIPADALTTLPAPMPRANVA